MCLKGPSTCRGWGTEGTGTGGLGLLSWLASLSAKLLADGLAGLLLLEAVVVPLKKGMCGLLGS